MKPTSLTRLGALLIAWLVALIGHPAVSYAQQATIAGRIHVAWGDPPHGPPVTRYALVDDRGRTVDLLISDELVERHGGPTSLNGRRATISGTWQVAERVAPGAAAAPELRATALSIEPPSITGAPPQSGDKPYIEILCRFGDSPTVTPRPLSDFQAVLSTSAPGVGFYWAEVSADAIDLQNTQVVGWYDLPHPLSYYSSGGNPNLQALLDDCVATADAVVDFPSYFGIIVQFNQDIGCCAWGGSATRSYDGQMKTYGVMWMPAWAVHNWFYGVYTHEMGHSLGLPHSSGPYGNVYDSKWDVMSDLATNFNASVQSFMGDHTIAYHKDLLGWIPPARKLSIQAAGVQSIVLERSALPSTNSNPVMAEILLPDGSGRFYTIEARRFTGYDVGVPGEAVVIHEVYPYRSEPAHVVDPDNNGDPNDAGAQWLPGETFTDPPRGISVQVTATTATGFGVTIMLAPPVATQLALATQPGDAVSAWPIPQQPVVELRDANNQRVAMAGVVITAEIASGSGVLGGTSPAASAKGGKPSLGPGEGSLVTIATATTDWNGVATFTSLTITGTGPHTLSFSAPNLTSAISASFTVLQPVATMLHNKVPVTGLGGAVRTVAFYVITLPTGAVQLRVGTGPGGSGDVDLYVRRGDFPTPSLWDCRSEGSTTYESCIHSTPAAGDWYIALFGYRSYADVTLVAQYITSPTGLAMIAQPGGAASGMPFFRQPAVELLDANNQAVPLSGTVVTVVKASGSGTLSGPTVATTVLNGVATFTDLTITGTGSHTLSFSAPNLTEATSAPFTVLEASPQLSDVICELLATCHLSPDQIAYVDAIGNQNERLDLGDMLAWIDVFGGSVDAATMGKIRSRAGR